MARRPSVSSRRKTGSSSASPRVRSDGKVDCFCPQCGAQYRVDADALEDAKIQCSQCTRTFFAKATAGKKARKPDHSKVYLGFGAATVVIILSFLLIGGGDGKRGAKQTAPQPVKQEVDLLAHPRAKQLENWQKSLAAGDTFGLRNATDLGAMQKLLAVSPEKDYPNSSGAEREALETAILAAMTSSEQSRFLRELELFSVSLVDEASATADRGAVRLSMAPRRGDAGYDANSNAVIVVQFRVVNRQPMVTGWEVVTQPVVKAARKDTFKPHETIERPKESTISEGGQQVKVTESTPVALDHLTDTPADVRKEVDRLVANIVKSGDPDAPGGLFAGATLKLRDEKLKKAAMPRMLNAMYELYGDVNANNMRISQVDRALRDLTGFSFNYQVKDSGDAAKDKATRESVVRQWFAWWWRYANGEFDKLIDKEEELLPPAGQPSKPAKN
ncbi:MAG: zinc-ribbon domain [Planctomycetota bacterium]